MFVMTLRYCLLVVGLMATSSRGQESKLMPDYHDHECIRPCVEDGDPMTCRYRFVAESYQTLSRACMNCTAGVKSDCRLPHCVTANGVNRNIKTINRGIPGPTIQVCQGDTVVIDLENHFANTEGLTIHWHGLLQKLTPWMDGVVMITQCPVTAHTTFQYKFVAVDPGTHFWHAHTGVQRGDGIFGSFIVRQPPSRELHHDKYDYDLPEHVFVLNEWSNRPMIDVFTDSSHSKGRQTLDAVLINGRTIDKSGTLNLPRTEFKVESGKKYRFRVISAGSLPCPVQVSIDNHTLILIAGDGQPFEPFEVQSFDIYSAERYDFVLDAKQVNGSFWLRAKGLGSCQSNNVEDFAVIHYVASDTPDEPVVEPQQSPDPEITGMLFNNIPVETSIPLGDPRTLILGMNAVVEDDDSLLKTPDHQFLLGFGAQTVNNLNFFDPDLYPVKTGPYSSVSSLQINKITNMLAPVPLLTQMDDLSEDMFCNSSTDGARCENTWCQCIHKLTVKKNDLVEMVVLSESPGSGFTHPVHLHGYIFRVVAYDRKEQTMTKELFLEMDKRGEITRKLHRAPFKDTVPLPNGGYFILRFKADNPGVWFMHCHLLFHAEMGMALALEVLDENGRLPEAPENFPRCGHFSTPDSKQLSAQEGIGSKPNLKTTDTAAAAVIPGWVLPVVLSLAVGIVGLSVTTFILWRKSKIRHADLWTTFPTYNSHGASSPEESAVTETTDTHFSYTKKHERMGLTKN